MIKRFEDSHVKEVMSIWLNTNITAHSFIPKKYWVDNYNIVKDEYLPVATSFIYEENNTIKGFISIIDNSFIGALFVSEEYQGQGIGNKLIDYSKELYSHLELGVYVENYRAINFYKKCNFKIKTEQPNEDSGFMEYIMEWRR
ncbi:putative N-acetyltransferase YjaB [Pelotomaculum schinkii]|uniref:Putative N-acetyltransferase YjaB n=1 Tax=Pelotomaculum schinkii TaxID=78350 RepID=A0A4Y7RCJ0_9FIRM|nr:MULTISPECIES: N-acetyltransferase [Pelotomaculum]TEB06037.1 putative N-acetyltransferase YjaB [Pelotomaculum schinkii]TEB15848.1 putative N-acetyltransferase YjaB [Pelotomaculum sp. FP]